MHSQLSKLCASALLAVVLPVGSLHADILNLQQGVNGYEHLGAQMWFNQSAQNHGAATTMLAGAASFLGGPMRPVLAFNLSDLPAGVQITAITLALTTKPDQTGSGTIGDLELHRINGAVTMIEGTGTGGSSSEGVNWVRPRAGILWNNDGGDFEPAVLSTITAFSTGDLGVTKTFATSSGFVDAAQEAFDNAGPLELVITSPTTSSSDNNWVRFVSDDWPTTSQRPLLTIDYIIPEPGSVSLAMGAMGWIVFRSRRRA